MSDVEEACKSVIACVEAAVSATTTLERRVEAYHAYEDFKETSPLCAKCGFVLAAKGNPALVRHIGLQLVEHCIKFRWNMMAIDDKRFIKDNVMKMMAEGTDHLLVEQAHIKDALAKLLVEMIKREWPQQWPQLMKELNDLAIIGETQKELVLLTFLRLAEDVVDLQTVEGARRRDLYQALVKERREICGFFVRTLETHYSRYRDLRDNQNADENNQELSLHRQLTETTLLTMAGFMEWTPLKEVMESDGLLPRIFCYLLSDRNLRVLAAECLLQVLGQKPKKDELRLLLALFNQETLNAVASALTSASSEPLSEAAFLFMKKLCSIAASLGQNCVTHWSLELERPSVELFAVYLDFLLSLMQHPSQAINAITLPVWASLFRHSDVSCLDIVRNLLPKFFKVATEKISKVGYPSRNDSPACAYARLDFDDDENFAQFLGKFRVDLTEAVRLATLLNPIAGFQMVSQWLQTLLVAKIEVGSEPENGHCSLNSPSSIRWDALVNFMDGVFSRFLSSPNPKPSTEEGIFLLESLLNFETEDPVIQSYALSCISNLGIFLTLAPGSLPNVLNKLFSCAIFTLPNQPPTVQSRALRNLRRHACAGLVKLCHLYPKLVMSCFDQIYSSVKRIQEQDKLITQLEACTLIEALLILSNEFNNYDRQCKFVVEVVSPATGMLARNDVKVIASSPEAFLSFIGLTEAPVEATADDSSGYNRSQLLHSVNIFMAFIKRCKWPDDIEVAKKGGFYCEGSQTYHSAYCRNPATPYAVSLLPIISQLLRTYNHFWSPEMRARVHPAFAAALDIYDSEKNSILGVRADGEASDNLGSKQPIDRAKSFMCTFQDYCLQILGNAGQSLGPEYYQTPGLSDMLVNGVLTGLEQLPDFRLRPILRVFLRPFVQRCPAELQATVVLPLLKPVLPFMFQKLNAKWEKFRLKYANCADYETEMTEEQELLDDQLNRLLSREYLDLLAAILLNKRGQPDASLDSMNEDQEGKQVDSSAATISAFGATVLKTEELCSPVVMAVFNALHWSDTTASFKALQLSMPLLKLMFEQGFVRDEGGAAYLLRCVLLGLQVLGEHDINQTRLVSLGLALYQAARPLFPGLCNTLLQIPGCTPEALEAFETQLHPPGDGKGLPEKKKKEIFKRLISPIIGKNIGQQFKAAIQIMNLPPMFRPQRMAIEEDAVACVDLPNLFGQE
ncbi:exportin-5-like protein Ranbp21 [Rhipicephalus microplus]|uniref:exportin-5-like protein Ranbp21 n=1 Tax=Rhipicephalus microplus TaxID=6941 RepID=UPI003F6A6D57